MNATLVTHNAKFVLTGHFALYRVNDPRNVPPITIAELESILDRLVQKYVTKVLALSDQTTFNVRCSNSHINIPCGFHHTASGNGKTTYEISAITVMRKKNFHSKDPVDYIV
ncbi:hypothetical protein [Paraburkholderia sp. MM6662-R1]|uniref:hypothetical protein n=1 Tax=Paraburkholderia sp. MM6662-R1 TaxID=2991066 RepID=UPI003D19DB99